VTTGLILLLFIAAIITFFVTRIRRRMGLGAPPRIWAISMVAVALVILMLWAYQAHG
jgi:predicted PurR-regulated permease PerM